MGLTQCPDCGRDVSDRAPACPACGAPMAATDRDKPQKVVARHGNFEAGKQAGQGCMLFFTSTPMAFVIFFLAWFVGCTYLADRTGAYQEGVTPSLWLGFGLFVAPVILAIVGRKVIRRVIPLIMGSGLLVVFVSVGFIVLMLGLSMFVGCFFHWPGAH